MKNLREAYKKQNFNNASVAKKMQEYLQLYTIIGGMPRVVNDYIKSGDLNLARKRQSEIVASYKNDVIKYAETQARPKILKTFESIPAQLSRKNKKFFYDEIDANDNYASERKYGKAIFWLKDAGIVNFCYNLSEPALPLNMNKKIGAFKIYMRDNGLLMSMLDRDVPKAIISGDFEVNQGGIIENLFAEEIMTRYGDVTYFERKNQLEIDFILNIDGVATAVEVKSGNNLQAKSLDALAEKYKTVKKLMKFEPRENIEEANGIWHCPLFMMMFL